LASEVVNKGVQIDMPHRVSPYFVFLCFLDMHNNNNNNNIDKLTF